MQFPDRSHVLQPLVQKHYIRHLLFCFQSIHLHLRSSFIQPIQFSLQLLFFPLRVPQLSLTGNQINLTFLYIFLWLIVCLLPPSINSLLLYFSFSKHSLRNPPSNHLFLPTLLTIPTIVLNIGQYRYGPIYPDFWISSPYRPILTNPHNSR